MLVVASRKILSRKTSKLGLLSTRWHLLFPRKLGRFPVSLSSVAKHQRLPQAQILTRSDQVGNDFDSGSLRESVVASGHVWTLGPLCPRSGFCVRRERAVSTTPRRTRRPQGGFVLAPVLWSRWIVLHGGLRAYVGGTVETLILFWAAFLVCWTLSG